MFSARDRVRFWSKCEPVAGGCIEWRGSTTGSGYGHFHHDGRLKLAHHTIAFIHRGTHWRQFPEVPRG